MAKPSPRLPRGRLAAPAPVRERAPGAAAFLPRRSGRRSAPDAARSLPSVLPQPSLPEPERPSEVSFRLQRPGDAAVLADAPEVNGHQECGDERQEDHVEGIPP